MLFHFPSNIGFDTALANLVQNDTHKRWDNHLFSFLKCLFQPQTSCVVLMMHHLILLSLKTYQQCQ